jgi:DNA-binding MarR family transcriptional regulator
MELLRRRDSHLNGVVDSLRRITQAIRLSSSAVQDRLGITGAQLFVLQQLAEAPGASLRELADRTLTDQSSVSVVVGRMVDAGQVMRRTSAADARKTELTLTTAGRALLRRAPPLAQPRLVAALRGVSALRLGVTASVLDQVACELGSTGDPAPMFFEPPARKRRVRTRGRTPSPAAGRTPRRRSAR